MNNVIRPEGFFLQFIKSQACLKKPCNILAINKSAGGLALKDARICIDASLVANFQATFTYVRGGCGAEAGRFWHPHSATVGMLTHTWRRMCHFLRREMVLSARFRNGRGKFGVGPVCCGADFAPAPPLPNDPVCVNACNDLCWSQFSTHLRPRPLRACINVP